jgi:hypothetical protein
MSPASLPPLIRSLWVRVTAPLDAIILATFGVHLSRWHR